MHVILLLAASHGCSHLLLLQKSFQLDSYLIYRCDRSDGYGGVLVACQSTLTCEQLTFDTNVEIVVCCIKLREVPQPLIICALYRPPNNDLFYMTELCNVLSQVANNYSNSPTYLDSWRY